MIKLSLPIMALGLFFNKMAFSQDWSLLPSNENIYEIERYGDTMWVATDCGILFQNDRIGATAHYNFANSELKASAVKTMELESDGKLWAGSGSNIYLKSKGEWIKDPYGFDCKNAIVSDIHITQKGDIWVACSWNLVNDDEQHMGDLFKLEKGRWVSYGDSINVGSNHWFDIENLNSSPNGTVWFTHRGTLFTLNGKKWSKQTLDRTFNHHLSMAVDSSHKTWALIHPDTIIEMRNGVLTKYFVPYPKGFKSTYSPGMLINISQLRFDGKGKLYMKTGRDSTSLFVLEFGKWKPVPMPLGYEKANVNLVSHDGEEMVVAGSNEFAILKGKEWILKNISGLPLNGYSSFRKLRGNRDFWVATKSISNRQHLVEYDGTTWTYVDSIPQGYFTSVSVDWKGRTWLAGYGGLVVKDNGQWIFHNDVMPDRNALYKGYKDLVVDNKNQRVWVLAQTRPVTIQFAYYENEKWYYGDDTKFFGEGARVLSTDKFGNLLIGSYSGLFVYHKGEIESFRVEGFEQHVADMQYDSVHNCLWRASGFYSGFQRMSLPKDGNYDGYKPIFKKIFTKAVDKFDRDDQGNIWLIFQDQVYVFDSSGERLWRFRSSNTNWSVDPPMYNIACYTGNKAILQTLRGLLVLDRNYSVEVMETPEIRNELQVFPNPIVNQATIETSNDIELDRAELYDIKGKLRREWSLKDVTYLDRSTLSGGIYLLRVFTHEGQTFRTKVVIE